MLDKWCQEAYCDGVNEMYASRTKPVHFMFWNITMLSMLFGTCYFFIKIVITRMEFPTATTYKTIPVTELALPEILVCFNGGLNGTALQEAEFSNDLISALSGTLTLGMMDTNKVNKSKEELENFLSKNKINILQLYQKLGYKCEDLIEIVYQAATDRIFDNIACKNVSRVMSPFYGTCLLYEKTGIQHWPGTNGGIKLYLKNPPDSLTYVLPDIAQRADRSHSFILSIENEFFIPTEKQYLVPMNMKTEVILDPKHIIRLPESRPACSSKDNRSSNICFNRCFGDVFFDNCGCYPFRYYNSEADKFKEVCNVFEEFQACNKYDFNRSALCELNCIPNCDEWIYDVTISYAPSGMISKSYASLWIGYDSMQYTKIEDIYTFSNEDAVANVGYQANLWLGVSVVTLVQLVYHVFVGLWKMPGLKQK